MIYFDTAYLLKCYLAEPGHQRVRQLARQLGPVACCELGKIECRAGIHRHLREGKLTLLQAQQLFQLLRQDDAMGLWSWLPLTGRLVELATQAYEHLPASVFLRSADALHLACAVEQGFPDIYSNDRHLLAAASHFGLVGKNVIP